MEPLVLIVHSDLKQSALLKEFLEESGLLECVLQPSAGSAAAWLSKAGRRVGALFIGEEPGPEAFNLLGELARAPGVQPALVFLIRGAEDGTWDEAISGMGRAADSLLVKPVTAGVIEARLPEAPAHATGGALILNDAGASSSEPELRLALGRKGFLRLFETKEEGAASRFLESQSARISLVVCDWEMPSLEGIRFLRRFYVEGHALRLNLLALTSRPSLERLVNIQKMASSIALTITGPFDRKILASQSDPALGKIAKHWRAESFLKEAALLRARGKPDYAHQILRHAVKTIPDVASLHEGLGDTLLALGGSRVSDEVMQHAISSYGEAMRCLPSNLPVALKSLDLFRALGRHHEGTQLAQRHLQRFGLDDALRARLGRIYFERGDYGAARVELTRAVKLNPGHAEAAALLRKVELVGRLSG